MTDPALASNTRPVARELKIGAAAGGSRDVLRSARISTLILVLDANLFDLETWKASATPHIMFPQATSLYSH